MEKKTNRKKVFPTTQKYKFGYSWNRFRRSYLAAFFHQVINQCMRFACIEQHMYVLKMENTIDSKTQYDQIIGFWLDGNRIILFLLLLQFFSMQVRLIFLDFLVIIIPTETETKWHSNENHTNQFKTKIYIHILRFKIDSLHSRKNH